MKDNKTNFFTKFFKGNEEGEQAKKKITPKLVLLLLTLGILLMFSGNIFQTKKEQVPVFNQQSNQDPQKEVATFAQKNNSSSVIEKYEKQYETQLKEALESAVGIKDVSVVVNLDSSESKVFETNTVSRSQQTDETDREGGKRKVEDQSTDKKVVIIREGDKESPIVVKNVKPDIRGVLIVAKGADNIQIKKMIVDAVTRTLGVPSHRVAVLPKKN
ncbi:stage III sporulation protein AG [Microbacteriaceae bacterium 4G12]